MFLDAFERSLVPRYLIYYLLHHQLEVQSFGDYLNFVLEIPASNNKFKENINELTKMTEIKISELGYIVEIRVKLWMVGMVSPETVDKRK